MRDFKAVIKVAHGVASNTDVGDEGGKCQCRLITAHGDHLQGRTCNISVSRMRPGAAADSYDCLPRTKY